MKPLFSTLSALVLGMLICPLAQAQVCEEPGIQSELQFLRRVSLDLNGRIPTYEQYQEVIEVGSVTGDMLEGLLHSEDFTHQIRQYHRDLLWTNLDTQRLSNNNFFLAPPRRGNGAQPYSSIAFGKRQAYRGAQVSCLNEPARFDADGQIQVTESETPAGSGQMIRQEGYVEVQPYWAPETTIRVCAFDAQTNEMGTNQAGRPINCRTGTATDCGCGPNLNWCMSQQTQIEIRNAMLEQMLEFTTSVVDTNQPYSDVITGQTFKVNGPLVHYFKYLTSAGPNFVTALPDAGYPLPDLQYSQREWVTVTSDADLHAGVLTMPGYLLKFQSDRGRANRFYNSFLCTAFQAPEGGLPAADDPCNEEPDLTKRCGCAHCHQSLEPAAAHWGRWAEAGLANLDSDAFPRYDRRCDPNVTPGSERNFRCRRAYITNQDSEYAGQLLAYEFADAHPDREMIIETGPQRIAQQALETGQFAQCTVNKIWQLIMNREPLTLEADAIATLTAEFKAGYNLRDLIRAIILRPEYRYLGREPTEGQ